MPTYTCEKCARIFKQKSGYNDHMKKKIDCTAVTAIAPILEEMKEMKREIQEMKHQPEITQETLPQFYEGLHNLLWNRAGLNPEPALENMSFFFAYRLIEMQTEHLELPKECHWGYIASIKKEDDLYDAIVQGTESFWTCPITQPYFKPHAIKKASLLYEIVQQINRIPLSILQQTDAIGDIFEYMLGRGMSTMPDHGQYFTNRTICKLAFKLAYQIKKTLRRADGSLCTFADWFCGTGGFPAEYIKGVNKNLADIDWKTESGAIYCQDMNMNSVTNTLLNLLILTGVPFSGTTIRSSNSFSDPIIGGANAPFPNLSIDYSFTNPPYGGDNRKRIYAFAYTKGKGASKQYLVNDDIKSIGIEDDDKVSAGVQLAMATLSSEGVCCIVLPQGFFFGASKKCVELRKKIAEDYKIWYIVDIASGSFLNTGTKTSMLVFQKGVGTTETVSFIGLDEKILVEATLEELQAKNYSLNYKQYLPQSAVEVDGFEMVKLGDIVSFKAEKSKKDKNVYAYIDIGSVDKGKFNVGELIQKNLLPGRAQYSVQIGDILLGTVRPNLEHYLHITPQIYRDDLIVSNGFSIMRCDTMKVLPTYLYSILSLPSTTSYLTERATGTTYPVVDDSIIGEIQIPLPSLERQQEIVDSIDGFTQLAHAEEQSLKLLEKSVMFEVKWMGMGKERVKLGDVCSVKTGKYITKATATPGIYPTYGGGDAGACISEYNRENEFMISKDGVSEKCVRYVSGKFFLNHHGWTIEPKNNATYSYVGYWLLSNQDKLYELAVGTAQKGINQDSFYSIEIPLPSLAEQQTLHSDFDEIRHKHAKIAEYKAKAQAAIQRLIPGANTETVLQEAKSSEAHSSQCQVKEDESGCTCRIQFENNIEEKEELVVAVQPAPVKIKKTVTRKSIKPVDDVKQDKEELVVAAQPAPIKRKIVKRIIEE